MIGSTIVIRKPNRLLVMRDCIIRKVTALAAKFRLTAIERDQKRILPQCEIEQLGETGFYGITVPRKYGGPEVSAVTLSLAERTTPAPTTPTNPNNPATCSGLAKW